MSLIIQKQNFISLVLGEMFDARKVHGNFLTHHFYVKVFTRQCHEAICFSMLSCLVNLRSTMRHVSPFGHKFVLLIIISLSFSFHSSIVTLKHSLYIHIHVIPYCVCSREKRHYLLTLPCGTLLIC